jgi:hypothetical protein
MRVLLDECVPKRLRTELTAHAVRTVVDNRIDTLRPLMAAVREALTSIAAKELKVISV